MLLRRVCAARGRRGRRVFGGRRVCLCGGGRRWRGAVPSPLGLDGGRELRRARALDPRHRVLRGRRHRRVACRVRAALAAGCALLVAAAEERQPRARKAVPRRLWLRRLAEVKEGVDGPRAAPRPRHLGGDAIYCRERGGRARPRRGAPRLRGGPASLMLRRLRSGLRRLFRLLLDLRRSGARLAPLLLSPR
eukprot:6212400-Pleurochrysis_carterae.AAC.1